MISPTNPGGEPLAVQPQDDQIFVDLIDLARYLWGRKKLIIASALLGALIMAGISLTMQNVYESKVLLAPAQDEKGGLSALAGQFGGIAALAGIELGGGDHLLNEGIALFTSREFLLAFIRDNNLKPKIFYDKWNDGKNRWKEPGFISKTLNKAKAKLSDKTKLSRYNDPNEPIDWDTYELFKEDFISVSQDKKTSLITVSVRAHNPKDAMLWASEIVTRANEKLRQSKKAEAEDSIAYLQKMSNETSVVDMQKAIYQLIEAQTKTVMFANAKQEFAFKTIDPAFYPEKKISPNRLLLLLAGGILGGLLPLTYHLTVYLQKKSSPSSKE